MYAVLWCSIVLLYLQIYYSYDSFICDKSSQYFYNI